VSYDHLAGLATRRQAKHAQVCAVAFADSNLPRAHVTGAPVRRELRNLLVSEYRSKARHVLGIPEENTLIVFMGGSLGSQSINTVAVACSQQQFLFDGTNISVLHICGERFLQEPMPEVANGIEYQRVGYESRMAEVYAASDIIVARAGASTVAEIATVGVASVLIPWPGAADNHQEHNARWLSNDGAAILSDDASCRNGATLQVVQDLASNKELQTKMAQKARQKGDIHRSNELVKVIENAASSPRS
jgi:UDP-N-acetylglucosamine--N-acetylmuramyl-(pentapeptide) pyrophosphoryl-undecaprenol N-acetylglucosamine transferase